MWQGLLVMFVLSRHLVVCVLLLMLVRGWSPAWLTAAAWCFGCSSLERSSPRAENLVRVRVRVRARVRVRIKVRRRRRLP